MENGKKSKILVVAFILGTCFLVLLGFVILNELIVTDIDYRGGKALYDLTLSKEEYQKIWIERLFENKIFWWFLISFIISIPAVLLNFFGWFKNMAKNILIAAILYLVTLNIPSAVLCFICSRNNRKLAVS